jgi:hypothetical protein
MTTEKDNNTQEETTVSEAEDNSQETTTVDTDRELIKQAAENAEATAETQENAAYLTVEDLDRILGERKQGFDNYQGRAQQYTNNKVQEIQDQAKSQMNEFMGDISSILDEEQKEQLNEKMAARKQQLKDEKINKLIEHMENPTANTGSGVSTENLDDLESAVKDTATALGLTDLDVRNNKQVWKGWSNGMSFSQTVKLANSNLRALAQTKNVNGTKQSATEKVPPTTQGAPTQPKRAYRNLGELSDAFTKGNVSLDDYRKIKQDL